MSKILTTLVAKAFLPLLVSVKQVIPPMIATNVNQKGKDQQSQLTKIKRIEI